MAAVIVHVGLLDLSFEQPRARPRDCAGDGQAWGHWPGQGNWTKVVFPAGGGFEIIPDGEDREPLSVGVIHDRHQFNRGFRRSVDRAASLVERGTGEGRDRTYSAFSILFLMAKAGEVQPLMQAIGKHPNTEVRLTSVKLLTLSNQQQVLPGLRSLASRDSLPPEVHTAVMEAIYQLSTQTREVA